MLSPFVARLIRGGGAFRSARARDFTVRFWAAVAIELPRVADLLNFIQIQIGDQKLVFIAAGQPSFIPGQQPGVAALSGGVVSIFSPFIANATSLVQPNGALIGTGAVLFSKLYRRQ